jgi:hypothetical protein
MNVARRLILAAASSLSLLLAGMLLAAPTALAEESCPNAASRQGPSAALPECRVYEQVTPVDKGDSRDIFGGEGSVQVREGGLPSPDGNSFLLYNAFFSVGPEGSSNISGYLYTRGASGWTGRGLGKPGPGVQSPNVYAVSSDATKVAIRDNLGAYANVIAGDPAGFSIEDLVGPVGGPYDSLSFQKEFTGVSEPVEIMGGSADLSHVLLESTDHALVPAAAGLDEGSNALYEAEGGQLQLVDLTSGGSLLGSCGAILGNGALASGADDGGTHNAVSEDGSKVIFTAPDPKATGAGCWNKGTVPQENAPQLYMREDGDTTIDLSAPDPGVNDPKGPQAVVYAGASGSGSKVFFVTETELTADDTTHAPELYEYDSEAPAGERLVRVSSGDSGNAEGNVDFVGAVSNDGSTVYFSAFGALAPGATPLNEENEGQVNLYRYDTNTKHTTFIAKIGSEDYPLKPAETPGVWWSSTMRSSIGRPPDDEFALVDTSNWYTTADGQYLVFGSIRPLTGYNNGQAPGSECEKLTNISAAGPEQCVELFRYDAKAEENGEKSIVCVSCGPPGSHPTSPARFTRAMVEAEIPSGAPPRPISEDGSHVFFDTTSALTPNASENKLQVYEWHDGTISLISSPSDLGSSWFEGSSADGNDVFFGTHAQLSPQDTDQSGDLYDARVDGGFAGLTPTECTGTGCQGVPAAPPIFATPSSVTFEGVGNFAPAPESSVKPPAKGLTSAQKLTKALKACARDRNSRKRKRCELSARKKYGSAHKSTRINRRGK